MHTPAEPAALTIAITGSTGFIGSHLVPYLARGGHTVRRLVRERPASGSADIYWNPATGEIEAGAMEGVDAVINLAGENLAHRWTAKRKAEIRRSRVEGTRLLSEAIASLARRPRVLISASAVGFHGSRGDEILDESSTAGDNFLAGVCIAWEAACEPARASGVRVVNTRSGIVLHPSGGALGRLLPIFRIGAGGKAGSGAQWVSWIAMHDWLRAVDFLLRGDALSGPVNLVAPNPVTNAEMAHALGHALGRPTIANVPAAAFKLALGEMAAETVLASQRAVPRRLLAAGFEFRYPSLDEALKPMLGE